MTTYTRHLGSNRGKLRLWLERGILADNGFRRGDAFTLLPAGKDLLLVRNSDGDRHVAGTDTRPVIDINSTAALAVLGKPGDTLEIVGSPGLLRVRLFWKA